MLHIIVAMTEDRVIGKRGALPWHISEDLKRFKRMTTGQTVIMGKNTFNSIGRPLPNRNNIMLDHEGQSIEGVEVCRSIPEAMKKAQSYGQEVYVIGGAKVYEQMLPQVDILHISHVKQKYDGDILFPEYDASNWEEEEREDFEEFTAVAYRRAG